VCAQEWRFLIDALGGPAPSGGAPPVRVWALESQLRSDDLLAAFEARLARQVLPALVPAVGVVVDVRNADGGFLCSWSRATIVKIRRLPPRRAAAPPPRPAGGVRELDDADDAQAAMQCLVQYSDFVGPDGKPLQVRRARAEPVRRLSRAP
jgi:hypothetical protein